MPSMRIIMEGDGCWPDLAKKTVHHTTKPIEVAILKGGMDSGLPSVSFRIELDDGSVVIAETSAQLFAAAARMFAARYPEISK